MSGKALRQNVRDLGSAQELERRLALARPMDTMRGFFFNGALAAVRSLGDEAEQHCLDAGGETGFTSFFRYPVTAYLRVIYTASWLLQEQHGGFEAAMRHVGSMAAPPFLSSALGKALLMVTQGNPRMLISNLPTAYRTAVSYGECSVQWTGPRSGLLITRHDFMLHLIHEGALLALFEVLGTRGVQVSGRQVGELDNEITFSWEQAPQVPDEP
ncbi:TIGR02265 family protein [Vitiosangium sp. GDMCC 1.1324]|uniref:TIGR02265 family protein n=1 Tax=Vitiosangium sp. (strain GDMCC 1.1324) TaxID=2138576 RepID=UPI000D3CBE33|nr:TIGR02265 family protein [Vitiosangium sp. GDMCC 1.1324]PTL83899.1 TIGR02265 family protein [Vitiosangium sp. GDMCC 1.1324]